MSASALRLGIVGCGAVVENYHLPAALTREQLTVAAFVDAAPGRAQALAQAHGAVALADHRHLVGLVDAALVAVPNHLHASVASDLLRAGIHVLVEKPLAPTVEACDQILDAAVASGAMLAVGLDFRFAPAIRLVKDLLDAEVLGPVERFDLRHGTENRWPLKTDYLFDRGRAGGGVLLDHGAHFLDHVLWWFGECSVESYRDDARGGVEGEAELALVVEGGARGIVELSRTRSLRNTCRIECGLGGLEVDLFQPYAGLALQLAGGAPALVGRVGGDDFAHRPYAALFERQLDDFMDAVMTSRPPLVPGSEGRRSIELIERCYAARKPLEQPWDYPRVYEALS